MTGGQRWLRRILAALIAVAAAAVLWHKLDALSQQQVRSAWDATGRASIAWSLIATGVSFACLSAYEWFAVRRCVPGRVPVLSALRIGALAQALANTLGFHAVTATAIRYAQYRRFELGPGDVARIVGVVAACVITGVILVVVAALAWLPVGAWRGWQAGIAASALLLVIGGLAWCRQRRPVPATLARDVALLLPVSALEMATAMAALYLLLPAGTTPGLAIFTLAFVSAMLLGVLSHAPGGLGVFEATLLSVAPSGQSSGWLLALLLYRVIYNLLPFSLAVLALLITRLRSHPSSALPVAASGPDQFDGG